MPSISDDSDLAHLFELLRMLPGPGDNSAFWGEVAAQVNHGTSVNYLFQKLVNIWRAYNEPFHLVWLRELGKRGWPWRTGGLTGQQCSLWLSGAMPEHGGDGITDRRRALESGWLLAVHRKSCSSWRSGS